MDIIQYLDNTINKKTWYQHKQLDVYVHTVWGFHGSED